MTTRGADYPRIANDDYPTPPEVTRALFDNIELGPSIYDPACGRKKKILKVAAERHYDADGNDIIFGRDFLKALVPIGASIVTNPPYGDRRGTLALRFIEQALVLTELYCGQVAMLLPVDFDSGKTRAHVFQHRTFMRKLILLDRIRWFDGQSGSTNHAWFIWDWAHSGPPTIKYIRINHGDHEPAQRRTHRAGRSARAAGRRHHVREAVVRVP